MPIARFQMPDGRIGRFEVPEGTTPEQAQAMIAESLKPKETKASDSPVDGMGSFERARAGFGKAFADIGRGASQLIRGLGPQYQVSADFFGLPNQADIEEAKRLDAPLMNTTGGTVGNIAGNVAAAIPTVAAGGGFLPAVATGAGMGALQPTTGDESRLGNMAIGGAAGAGGYAAGKGIQAAYSGAKALVEPFTQKGREQIAGRVISRFADNPANIAKATGAQTITGARPTLAEETGDVGLARLQDALRSVDPQINNAISARLADNNAARVGSLQSLAGDSSKRTAAEAAREAATKDMYTQATKAVYEVDDKLADLLKRPAVQQALERAKTLAKNEGRNFTFETQSAAPFAGVGGRSQEVSKQITGQGLQDLKMAMDQMLTDPASGFAGKTGDALKSLRGQIVSWMEQANPEFKAARTAYAALSKPINAMDVGEEIARRATSATSDLAGNPRMQANALLRMLQDEKGLIERSAGKGRGNMLADVMTPDQLNLLRSVASETDRAAAVASAGNGPGSATAQRMAAQNVLRQIVGPTGLPESWAENALANTIVGKPLNLVYGGVVEPKIQQELANAILDPARAKAVLAAAQAQGIKLPPGTAQQLLAAASRAVPPAIAVSGQR